MIEGRYGSDNPDGLFDGESPSPFARWCEAHGNFPTRKAPEFLRRITQSVDRSDDLDGSIGPWLSPLPCDELSEMRLPRLQQTGGAQKYGAALMGFEPSITIPHHPSRRSQLGFERSGIVDRNLGDDSPVKRLQDLKRR
ncbi:hypothetical protein GCM10007862_10670 [Dyella lipolytica]|nr:hypothetical protein GCM10007862_10670 [Dyella lipolytica]